MRALSIALVAATLAGLAAPAHASAPSAPASAAPKPAGLAPLPATFVKFFFDWKSRPQGFRVADLKVMEAGGELRVLCGAYDLPGQESRPFLVLGDSKPSAAAAWEPGSFPESDPLYPQLMDNLRLCQRLGAPVSAS